jgi:Major capsid protein Gp23
MTSLVQKWAPILDAGETPITEDYRRKVTAILLENQEKANMESRQALFEDAPTNSVGGYADSNGIAKYDPILIGLVRRTAPQLIAYDVCGVQPLTQPTGLIFAAKARYGNQTGQEALFGEADSSFSGDKTARSGTQGADDTQRGTNPGVLNDTVNSPATDFTYGVGMSTAVGEALGSAGGNAFGQMALTIEKKAVEAKTRALRAEYSVELVQDLKALHGLDAEQELINMLSTEITAEMNREVVRSIAVSAKVGAQYTTTPGLFDMDQDAGGRWSVEKFKGLMFACERDANVVSHDTRMGRGNFIICSSDVAAALAMTGQLDYNPAIGGVNVVDDSSTTFAGILNGRFKVYVDPYLANGAANEHYAIIGRKGATPYEAGMFYCPYQPLQLFRAVDPASMQPRIAFKSRYGIVAHPYATTTVAGDGMAANSNNFYRRIKITNLL